MVAWTAPVEHWMGGKPKDRWGYSASYWQCSLCQALVLEGNKVSHESFHDNFIPRDERARMSTAVWCDKGNHAFKEGTPGSESGSMTVTGDDGIKRSVQFDACPEHSFSANQRKELPEYGTPDARPAFTD